VALRSSVENQELTAAVGLQAVQVACLTSHLAGDVVKEGASGSGSGRKIGATESIERVNFEMGAKNIRGWLRLKNVTIENRSGVDGCELVGLMVRDEDF
jgi:hypothetical protein